MLVRYGISLTGHDTRQKATTMSDLLVMAFSTEAKAEAVRRTLLDMHEDHLIEPSDAAIAKSCACGLVKLNQLFHPISARGVSEMLWGPLVELLLRTPLTGNLAELGINDNFVMEAGNTLRSGNAVLLLLIRQMTTENVVAALRRAGGKFIRSSFDEARKEGLRAALARLRTARRRTVRRRASGSLGCPSPGRLGGGNLA